MKTLQKLIYQSDGMSTPEYMLIGAALVVGVAGGLKMMSSRLDSIMSAAVESAKGDDDILEFVPPQGGHADEPQIVTITLPPGQ
ncbi:MAG: hypothetical protein KDB22_00895 [Planctomycetales bacterium]|nr:hypothetical protein [Planctomycetales bacterium]